MASSRWEFAHQFCDVKAAINLSQDLPFFCLWFLSPSFHPSQLHTWSHSSRAQCFIDIVNDLGGHSELPLCGAETLCQFQRHRVLQGSLEGYVALIGGNSYLLTVGLYFPSWAPPPTPTLGAGREGEMKTLIARTYQDFLSVMCDYFRPCQLL